MASVVTSERGSAYRLFALAMMTSVYMLNLVDRGLIALLAQPIKEDLHLSDTQLGFLTGAAFGLFYALMGLPIARWADRGNRVTITSVAIGLWGLTVMACMLVTNYVQLVFARVAAAVGESGCKPPTYSLVGDLFTDPAERTRALSVYVTGSSLSTLLAYVLGGWLNETYGWRITFFLVGTVGLVLAIVVKLTVREPRDRLRGSQPAEAHRAPPIGDVFAVLWRLRALRHLSMAMILFYTFGFGMGPWQAAFMMRTHGMGTADLGLWLGIITGVAGVIGVLLGGYALSRPRFGGNEPAQMRVVAILVSLLTPCFIAFLMLPHKHQALAALVPLMMVFSAFLGPVYSLMQRLVPDQMRATMMATVMLLANLVGMSIGPQIVGILSDTLAPTLGASSLRYALLSMSVLALWSAFHFWRVARTVREDLLEVARVAIECKSAVAGNLTIRAALK